ncbi:MAG TPA: serine hydrolase domain-containing protein [Candidatus Aminicenantes bacterium]|nr:serine hydrolase domain-containing protein [Candidatus Aminicenantes bacterium]HRY66357.1 serine hydrolase domain-containing protein [Candidatus Aminicenantes bacterium]HRZ72596.1 serine hydrolase domain-containing protein [Candidatus Aminicenantes bacterium]
MIRSKRSIAGAAAAALLAAGLAFPAPAQAPSAAASAAKPALARLQGYIETFNSGVPGRMKLFFQDCFAASALNEIPVGQRVVRFRGVKRELGSLAVERVVSDGPAQASILAKTASGGYVLLKATVEKDPPHKLLTLMIDLVEDPNNVVAADPKAGEREFAAAVRAYLEEETRADRFSGVVLAARGPKVILHEAYGLADRDKKIPNRKDTKFNLGSINKNFTRAAVHQLARLGLLGLDDPVKKILPDYPNAQVAEKVTVRQLLNMTSGIPDFFGERYDAAAKEKILTLRDYLPLFADLPLEFEPGTSNKYSNGGYIVLGLIIEKLARIDYYAYVRENIFKPCGMTDTDSYLRDADTPNLARGYTTEGQAAGGPRVLNLATLPGRGSSAGGGYSTAADLLKYVLALDNRTIYLPDASQGLGLSGGAPGLNSALEWDPRSGYIVIVLTNFDPPTAGQAARRIVGWLPQ